MAEGAIKETKQGVGQKIASSHAPAKLWDHCLELECYIRSHTALDNYKLQGQVPKMILSGQTSNISPFVEIPWYGWVYYCDSWASYREP